MALMTGSARNYRVTRWGLLLATASVTLGACSPSPFFTGPGTATAPGAVPRDANGEPILKDEPKPDRQ